MSHMDRAELFAGLATELAAQSGENLTTQLIVERALEFAPGTDHASITVKDHRTYRTLAATSDLPAELDSAQYALHEGPCVASADEGEWFRSGDVGADPRWPRWREVATDHGIGSLLSVRLMADGKPFGALNLYAHGTGHFSDRDDVEMALLYTVHAAHALVSARLVANLETAMTSRHDIGVAQGFLMARYGLSSEKAFAAMSRVSQDTNVKLRQVALEIMRDGGLPGIESAPDADQRRRH